MLARIALDSLARRPGATAWTLSALGVVSILVTVYTTVALEVGSAMGRTLRTTGANAVARPAGGEPDWARAEAIAGEAGESVRLTLVPGTVEGAPAGLVWAEPTSLAALTGYWVVTGRRPRAAGECLLGRRLADRLGAAPGSSIEFLAAGSSAPVRLAVAGVLDSGDEDDERLVAAFPPATTSLPVRWPDLPPGHRAVPATDCRSCHEPSSVPFQLAERAVRGASGPSPAAGHSYLLLRVGGGEDGIARLDERLASAGVGLEVRPLRQIAGGEASVLERVTLLVGWTLAAVLALVAMAVGASSFGRIVERRKELALFVALGAHRRTLVRLLLLEHSAVGGAAGLGGFLVGSLAAHAVASSVFGAPAPPSALALVAALASTTFVALAVGATSVRYALRLPAAALLRGDG